MGNSSVTTNFSLEKIFEASAKDGFGERLSIHQQKTDFLIEYYEKEKLKSISGSYNSANYETAKEKKKLSTISKDQ